VEAALMALDFDPYKRPPAARLLAILVTGALFAWLVSGGEKAQADLIRRDPQTYYKHLAAISHRSPMVNFVIGVIVITIIVFIVDGLTSLFGRWLKERQIPPDTLP
jgi:Cu/Ag efflux pump CusA